MELEVYWLQIAQDKLKDIFLFYKERAGSQTAQKLVTGIVETTLKIQKQPEIGPIESGLIHRKQEFRYIIYKHYKILYWINNSQSRIEIANVFDTRQNPEKIRRTKT